MPSEQESRQGRVYDYFGHAWLSKVEYDENGKAKSATFDGEEKNAIFVSYETFDRIFKYASGLYRFIERGKSLGH